MEDHLLGENCTENEICCFMTIPGDNLFMKLEQDCDENAGVQSNSKRPRDFEEENIDIKDDATKEHKKAKFTSQVPACMRILLASKDAGPIIGKGGGHIKRLRENYNASVLLPDCPGPERILVISTTLSNACSILIDVMKAFETFRDTCLKLLVHQSQAGAIIGRSGSNIKKLREKCGSMIKVYPECAPLSSERVVEVRGDSEVVADTIYSLVEFLQTSTPVGPVYPYDPMNYDEAFVLDYGGFSSFDNKNNFHGRGMKGMQRSPRGRTRMPGGQFRAPFPQRHLIEMMPEGVTFGCDLPRMGGAMSRSGFAPIRNRFEGYNSFENEGINQGAGDMNSNPMNFQNISIISQKGEVEVSQVTIPSELAGSIIGKGGSRIKQIRSDSGAHIDIDDVMPGSNDRIITIKGTAQQIQHAQYLLQTSVKKYSGKY